MSDSLIKAVNDRLKALEADFRRFQAVSVRSEITGAFARFLYAALPTDFIAGRQWFVTDLLDGVNVYDTGTAKFNQYQLKAYTVATLPTANIGLYTMAFATNGRKSGEGAGVGTGVPVWFDGTIWRTFYDNLQVLA